MVATVESLTLAKFLACPETEPASELINGKVSQKPMPQGEHSTLQGELCDRINQVAKTQKLAYAFPELRCTFGGASIVPDVAVLRWERIPRQASGRVANRFEIPPDWAIEILSPDQSLTKVLNSLLHCSQHGTELGWLLHPEEDTILVVLPEQRVQVLKNSEVLPVLTGLPLELTVDQVFSWLTL